MLSGIDARFNALQADIARVEAAQRERLNTFITGVLVGAVVVLIVVAVWWATVGSG